MPAEKPSTGKSAWEQRRRGVGQRLGKGRVGKGSVEAEKGLY